MVKIIASPERTDARDAKPNDAMDAKHNDAMDAKDNDAEVYVKLREQIESFHRIRHTRPSSFSITPSIILGLLCISAAYTSWMLCICVRRLYNFAKRER